VKREKDYFSIRKKWVWDKIIEEWKKDTI
jgi:hypothetical protein